MTSRFGSFLAELKRRRVYHVAIAYIVVGLGVLGAAELILDPLGLVGARPFIVVFTLLGFPLAMVLAWAYEVKPEEPFRSSAPLRAAYEARRGSAFPTTLTLSFLVGSLTPAGCTQYVEVDADPGPQAYYRTGFPLRDVSGALESATASVVQILVQRSYETYLFAEDNAPTTPQLESPGSDVRVLAVDTVSSRETTTSTGVVIASSLRRLTILTTDHSTHFPDTIVNYFGAEGRGAGLEPAQRAIERISIKTQQANTVSGPRFVDPFEILARNQGEDLALVGVTFTQEFGPCVGRRLLGLCVERDRPPGLAAGDPQRLSLGSLVYIIGHPAGAQVVTHGIVSEPHRGPNASFLIDGLWNEGMSGAPILAIRGDVGGLEWVGISRAAAARTEYRLVAEEWAERSQDPRRPYEGPIYLQPVQEIRYGITFSVPMTVIRRFLDEEQTLVRNRGYPFPSF